MHLSDFDFDLPADRIALRPARPRDSARLLLVKVGRPAVAPLLSALEAAYAGGRGDAAILNGHARLAAVKALGDMGPVAGGTATLEVLARLRQVRYEPFQPVREEAFRAYGRVQRKKE